MEGHSADPDPVGYKSWMYTGPSITYFGLPQHAGQDLSAQGGQNFTNPGWGNTLPGGVNKFRSDHSGGIVQFLMGDGSVQSLSGSTDFVPYVFLSGMRDGETVDGAF